MTRNTFARGLGGSSCNGYPGGRTAGRKLAGSTPSYLKTNSAHGQGSRRGAFLSVREDRVWLLTDGGSVEALRQGDLSPRDQAWVRERLEEIARLNRQPPSTVLAQQLPEVPANRPGQEAAGDAERRDAERSDAGLDASKAPDATARDAVDAPAIHRHFLPFGASLGLRWDDRFY